MAWFLPHPIAVVEQMFAKRWTNLLLVPLLSGHRGPAAIRVVGQTERNLTVRTERTTRITGNPSVCKTRRPRLGGCTYMLS